MKPKRRSKKFAKLHKRIMELVRVAREQASGELEAIREAERITSEDLHVRVGSEVVNADAALRELDDELARCERITGADLAVRIH